LIAPAAVHEPAPPGNGRAAPATDDEFDADLEAQLEAMMGKTN
jgi:hypothetical protein